MKYLLIIISTLCYSQDFMPSYIGMNSKMTSNAKELTRDFYFNGGQFRAFEQFEQIEFGASINFYTQEKYQTINSYGLTIDTRYLFGNRLIQPFIGLGINYQKYKFYGSYFPYIRHSSMGDYLGNINYLSIAPSIGARYLLFEDYVSGLELFCSVARNLTISKTASDNFTSTSINNQFVFNIGMVFTGMR